MSSRLILLPPAPLRGRTAGDADEPAVTVEISIVIRAVESAAEAAQDLAERLCAVARGGARIENIPAQAAHVAGDTATAHPGTLASHRRAGCGSRPDRQSRNSYCDRFDGPPCSTALRPP